MSSAKGRKGAGKMGAPAHQNKFAFRHNPGSKKTKRIMAMAVTGLCRRCTEQIEWKKKYRKYKPLKTPGKCCGCSGRTVKKAYHAMCDECASAKKVCPKCMKHHEVVEEPDADVEDEKLLRRLEEGKVAGVSERERRAVIRELTQGLTPDYTAKSKGGSGDEGGDEDGDEDGGCGGGGGGSGGEAKGEEDESGGGGDAAPVEPSVAPVGDAAAPAGDAAAPAAAAAATEVDAGAVAAGEEGE